MNFIIIVLLHNNLLLYSVNIIHYFFKLQCIFIFVL